MHSHLINRINDCLATIGINALGYVGFPLMVRFVEVGFKVLGFNNDPIKLW